MKASESFRKRYTNKNLIETYEVRIKGSGAIGIDKTNGKNFDNNLQENIDTIKRKVKNNTYKFTLYKQKLISKGADSNPRVISIPTFRDRLTLRCLCDLLFDVYESSVKVDIPQIKIHIIKSAIESGLYDAYVKIDIKSFYTSIKHDKLFDVLRKRIKKPEIENLIRKAISNGTVFSPSKGETYTNEEGIPQGLSVSNVLAEIFMLDLDSEIRTDGSLVYIRYVDDILILCKEENSRLIAEDVIEKLDTMGLKAHPLEEGSKSEYGSLSKDFSFLGYLFSENKITVGIINKQRFEASIVHLLTTHKYRNGIAKDGLERTINRNILEWRLNLRITGCIFDGAQRGWLFYFSQINDLEILHQLDSVVQKLIKRFGLDGSISPKKLVKVYYEVKKRDSTANGYIINFDNLDREGKIDILYKYLGTKYSLKGKSDEEIDRLFSMRIGKVIKELEEDLQEFS